MVKNNIHTSCIKIHTLYVVVPVKVHVFVKEHILFVIVHVLFVKLQIFKNSTHTLHILETGRTQYATYDLGFQWVK